ncbi:TfoX/Sxy family protein [Undibacterium cyanobacteriorum]|uniref:TfoX/Sxy family protein n=1 Tax=Undibacterium cyanobacteriorum TaxID=3073561 RepID=A0ABY9RIY3_9BURK|nr:TfoX/Sxy family protein [Undibacterium sp. 20NA77.5]WMW81187.1 TfoX/Sxy family protein [Undibacterium sp. 20NA77.5]
MATDTSFLEFVMDQTAFLGNMRFKKMFGEYALYHNEVVVAFLCDNQFYLKPHPQLRAMLEHVLEAPPYPGAKNYLLLSDELDNPQQLGALIRAAAHLFPPKKPKTTKKKSSA